MNDKWAETHTNMTKKTAAIGARDSIERKVKLYWIYSSVSFLYVQMYIIKNDILFIGHG